MIGRLSQRFESAFALFLATTLMPALASAGIFRIDNLFGSESLGELQGIYDFEVAYGRPLSP